VNRFRAATGIAVRPSPASSEEAAVLLTFLIAMLALIIAVLVGAAVNPDYHENATGHERTHAPDWEASV
jgi:hypothetical protein